MKHVLFLRSEEKFQAPDPEMFGWLETVDQVQVHTIDISDDYQEIKASFENIRKKINQLLGYIKFDVEVFLCGNAGPGFVWQLKDFLKSNFPEVCFGWIEIKRSKEKGLDKVSYELWNDIKI